MKSFIEPSQSRLTALLTVPFIALIALTMTGCGLLTKRLPERQPVPASLMQPCQRLEPMDGKTGADVVRKFVEVGKQYNECAEGKRRLIEAVK